MILAIRTDQPTAELHLLSDVKKKARDGAERLRACLDGYFFELRR